MNLAQLNHKPLKCPTFAYYLRQDKTEAAGAIVTASSKAAACSEDKELHLIREWMAL